MIRIDGRQGEGGGQVLRSSLAFSALTREPFAIHHIRGNRSKPGLRAQHVAGVRRTASLCAAKVKGDEVGSHELSFEPGPLVAGRHEVDIGTAGSITLLTQAALLPALACKKPVELVLRGGTDVPLSPPMDFLEHVVSPYYRCLGRIELQVVKRGFMPTGQGLVRLQIEGHEQAVPPLQLTERPGEMEAQGRVVASVALQEAKVCERVASEIESQLGFAPNIEYQDTASVSVVANLRGHSGNLRAGCGMLGRRRLSSEKLARELVTRWKEVTTHENPVEEHLADQLIPLLALTGGELLCQSVSLHCRTNTEICSLFTGAEFVVEGDLVRRL